MKAKLTIIILVLILAGAGGAAYWYFQPGGVEMTEEVAPDPAATSQAPEATAPQAATPSGDWNMGTYDLTPDAEGLSKAVATMTLASGGVIKWRFYSNDAPVTVKRISQLISEGFYNGIIFHRVVPGFVVQAGDPNGRGDGGSGVKLKAEFNQHKHVPGIVSMARTQDPDSADSQFFIMLGVTPHLDGQYTVIGKVVEGFNFVEGIKQGDKIASFVIQ